MLETNVFTVERSEVAWRALVRYRSSHDIPDALIALTNAAHECEGTVTFDKASARRGEMTLIGRQ